MHTVAGLTTSALMGIESIDSCDLCSQGMQGGSPVSRREPLLNVSEVGAHKSEFHPYLGYDCVSPLSGKLDKTDL